MKKLHVFALVLWPSAALLAGIPGGPKAQVVNMSDERTPPPSETSTERTSPSISIVAQFEAVAHAGGRIVLYVAAFSGCGILFLRGAVGIPSARIPQCRQRQEHRMARKQSPPGSTDKGWRSEQETWGSAPADPGKVLGIATKNERCARHANSRVPTVFPRGEMRVEKRTLRFYRMGADAVFKVEISGIYCPVSP